MREILQELFTDTYNQTIKDNQEDFLRIVSIISKLCEYLATKNILGEEEIKEIFDFNKNAEILKEQEKLK